MLIELQIRTKIQHAWATAVETFGTYLDSQLKFNEGQKKWLTYFALTSSAFALIEKQPVVPSYANLSNFEIFQKTLYEFKYNHIKKTLKSFTLFSNFVSKNEELTGEYNLIILDIEQKRVKIASFSLEDLDQANEEYTKMEKKYSTNQFQVALVSTQNIKELSKAYPNYFFDTKFFIQKMSVIQRRYNKLIKENSLNQT